AARQRLDRSAAVFEQIGGSMTRVAEDLGRARPTSAPDAAETLASRAARFRTLAEQVPPMTAAVRDSLGRTRWERPAPDLLDAESLLTESAAAIVTVLDEAGTAVGELAGPSSEAGLRLERLASRIVSLRDTVAAESASLLAAGLPPSVHAIAALEANESLLVLGPPDRGITAVRIEDVLPGVVPGAPRVDPGRLAESMLTNAIAGLTGGPRPVVVVVHGSPSRIIRSQGSVLGAIQQRAAGRGIGLLEWPAALSQDPPAELAALLAEQRPVVYAVVGIDDRDAESRARADRVAAIVSSLLERGESVMVCLAPSTRPGLGETDSMAEAVEPLGLIAETGRPALFETRRGDQRQVGWEHTIVQKAGEHPLAAAVERRSTLIPWPITIMAKPDASEDGDTHPLLSLPDSPPTWLEGEWLGYWLTPATQRPLLRSPPSPGGTRDAEAAGSAIAWAVERPFATDDGPPQRAVVVGSHLWLFDTAADRPGVVDGRLVQLAPGNTTLFLSAVEWLAGNDDAVLPGANAFEAPVVQPIEPGRLTIIRWTLLAVLPLGVLALGAAVRAIRG
ncbi:MAG: hypothetical protein AAGF47_11850, partial [Planctomycetota bacterium]